MAALVGTLGYTQTVVTTANVRRALTAVYFASDREQEAVVLASALGVAGSRVQPFSGAALTVDDARGDLWLIVGNDQIQRFQTAGVG